MQLGRSAIIRVIKVVWLKANKLARAEKPVSDGWECRETEPRYLNLRNRKAKVGSILQQTAFALFIFNNETIFVPLVLFISIP